MSLEEKNKPIDFFPPVSIEELLEQKKKAAISEFHKAGTPQDKMYEKGRIDLISEVQSWIQKSKKLQQY